MPPVSTTAYPRETPVVDLRAAIVTEPWDHFFQALATLAVTVNGIPGQNLFALAAQPTLGLTDAGYIGWVTDYGHMVRWTGAIWEFAPGDIGNGFISDRAFAPQEVGWQLCDGSATTYLTVGGATLTATAYTTLALTTTAGSRKSGAAYGGALVAGAGTSGNSTATISGSTGNTTPTLSGVTDEPSDNLTDIPNLLIEVQSGVGINVARDSHGHGMKHHTHAVGSLAVSSHLHAAGTLGVDSHSHGIGTLDPNHSVWLPYFRR